MIAIGAPPSPATPRPAAAAVLAPRGEALAALEEAGKASPEARLAPNPSLRVDPALNIVVIEFRDASGEIRRSMPTERELASYRAALRRGDEGASAGGVSPPPRGAAPVATGTEQAPSTASKVAAPVATTLAPASAAPAAPAMPPSAPPAAAPGQPSPAAPAATRS